MKRSRGNKFADVFYGIRKVLGILLLVAAALVLVVFVASRIVLFMGKANFRKSVTGMTPTLTIESSEESGEASTANAGAASSEVWEEGWVRYDGKIYAYNEDIMTILLLGIDKQGKVSAAKTATDGGQSDAIFLLVANPHTQEISLIGVNRDTIVDVLMVGIGEDGGDVISESQIAVQHGFGNGLNESCELTRDRVSELFYDLPINAYASFNMGGIADLNDALGGVEVTVLEDLTKCRSSWTKGAQVTLEGKDAYYYVKWRDTSVWESARGRLERQKQYINAFLQKAIAATKADLTVPVTLYNSFKDYIVTDLTADEIAYLASELSGYTFEGEIYTLEGTTEMKGEHEAFYPDEDALKELVIQVFYEEVETD